MCWVISIHRKLLCVVQDVISVLQKKNRGPYWLYYDDLCTTVQRYPAYQDHLGAVSNGWFFAVIEKSKIPSIANVNGRDYSLVCSSLQQSLSKQLFI